MDFKSSDLLKIIAVLVNEIIILPRSPQQYEDFDTTIKVSDVDKPKGGIVVSVDLVGSNHNATHPFFQADSVKVWMFNTYPKLF